MTSCRTETETFSRMQKDGTFDCCCGQQSVASPSLLVSGLTADIFSTFCGVFVVQCVKLMLIIFEFGVLLFDCFVCRQNGTCLKRFTRYGHYESEVECSCSFLLNRSAKNYSVWWGYAKSSWLWFFCVDTLYISRLPVASAAATKDVTDVCSPRKLHTREIYASGRSHCHHRCRIYAVSHKNLPLDILS